MAPPGKYRELQPTGIGLWDGFSNQIKETALTTALSQVPFMGRLFAFASAYKNPRGSLPIAIEFDLNLTPEERFDAYKNNYNAQGELTGTLAQLAEQAYIELGWTRRSLASLGGGLQWQPPENWDGLIPVITTTLDREANTLTPSLLRNRDGSLETSDEVEYGNSLSDVSFNRMIGGKGQENYIKKTGADKANIASTTFPEPTGLPSGYVTGNVGRAPQNVPFDVSEISGGVPQAQLEAGIKNIPESEKLLTQRTKAVTLQQQNKNSIKQFLSNPDGYNLGGILDGSLDFEFTMDNNGQLTSLNVFKVIDGEKEEEEFLTIITDDTSRATVNNDYTKFKIQSLTAQPDEPTETSPKGTSTLYDSIKTGQGGIGSFPLGQSLMAPGVPMPGSLQQQALSRVPLSDYRKALPAAMPGGGIPLMRGLYKTPLQLAQEAYLLSSRMGTFQPQGTIPGGTGAFGFQQYLGGQPNYIADLQAGLGAIQQVKQKIISGISPAQLTPAEQQIYTNYIGGTESNPYQGSENELSLRQQLTQLLPAPLRTAAQSNLQNIYNQALATRPSTVAGMPQSLMYGGALGTGSPFQSMQPMSVNVPTGTSPVGTMGQANQAPTQTINVSGSTNMNNVMTNNNQAQTQTQTADGKSIIFNRNPDTGYMQATLNEGRAGATGVGAATAAEIDALGLGLPTTPTGGAFGNIMVKRLNDKVIDAWTVGGDGKRTPLMQNLTNSKEANDQIKAQQIKVANEKAAAEAKKIMTGSSKTQLGWDAPPSPPGMNAPIQPYSPVPLPRDITDPNFNVNENIFNF